MNTVKEGKKHRPPIEYRIKMDFDSPDPDVEKEFPGLFASANQKKDEDECKSLNLSRKFTTQ